MRWITILMVLTASGAARAVDDPFNPSGYIDHKEALKTAHAGELTSAAIFRINGMRYVKLASPEGAVYLPSSGEMPELHEEFAICQQHLRLMREVLPTRENLPVEPRIRKHQKAIVSMIRKCNEGGIAGPVVVETQPDGAVVEIKSKDPKAAHAQRDETPNTTNK